MMNGLKVVNYNAHKFIDDITLYLYLTIPSLLQLKQCPVVTNKGDLMQLIL